MAARASPYQGLMPYGAQDARYFFGRERETRLVIANLFASPLTLLYGPSGVGKTSLLNAGVVHALRGRNDVTVLAFRDWQDDPLPALSAAIAPPGVSSGLTLAELVSDAARARPLMLILDQFEERLLY